MLPDQKVDATLAQGNQMAFTDRNEKRRIREYQAQLRSLKERTAALKDESDSLRVWSQQLRSQNEYRREAP